LDSQQGKSKGTRFESAVDADGIKTVIEYTERDNKTYKISRKVQVKTITTRTNKAILERKDMEKFGKSAQNADSEKQLIVRSEDEIHIEFSKKITTQVNVQDEAIDKFYEGSVMVNATLNKEKKAWTTMNAERQKDRDAPVAAVGLEAPVGDKAGTDTAAADAKPAIPGRPTSTYMPPSMRTDGKGGGKGGGKDMTAQVEASLRVTNLSEDVREGDLHDLFSSAGRIQRVYLAKDMNTGISRGFAFVTYCNRADAERAIKKLNGFGYDNLILQVQFAKPKQ
jgi:translation initiation factor 3 subunit G